MFRIEFFTEDRNLVNALRALTGIAVGQPSVVPVINATVTRRGNTSTVTPKSRAGSLTELFFEHLGKLPVPTIARKDVNAFSAQHGRPQTTAQHLINQALKAGLLKREDPGKGLRYVGYRIVTGGKKS